jgi:site-specific DNA recombinase
MRVIGYVRVSTDRQAESGLSLEAQELKIRQFAALHDLELVEVVVDAGESASSLKRPGLQRALGMLEGGEAGGLLIAKLDRLTRSVKDLGTLVEGYFSARFSLLSVADSIDTRSAAGRLVLNVLASVAQWEREAIGERTRDAIAAKVARGELLKGAPRYGYGPGGLECEHEQLVLARVQSLRAEGLPVRAVAHQLTAEGLISRRSGQPYGKSQVARMVDYCRRSPLIKPRNTSNAPEIRRTH